MAGWASVACLHVCNAEARQWELALCVSIQHACLVVQLDTKSGKDLLMLACFGNDCALHAFGVHQCASVWQAQSLHCQY